MSVRLPDFGTTSATPAEQEQIQRLRCQFTPEELEETSSDEILRFLRNNRSSAVSAVRGAIKWRRANLPIAEDEVKDYFGPTKFSMLDKLTHDGLPVLSLRFSGFQDQRVDVDLQMRAYLYLVLECLKKSKVSRFTAIADCSGVPKPPTAFILRCSKISDKVYPGLCSMCVLYPVPVMLRKFFNGVLRFCGVTRRDASRIALCDNTAALAGALHLDEADLPEIIRSEGAVSCTPSPTPCDSSSDSARSSSSTAGRTTATDGGECVDVLGYSNLLQMHAPKESSVTTPWYPGGAIRRLLTLEDEVNAFAHFALMSPDEVEDRHSARVRVQAAVRGVWPDAIVRLSGSTAYGCAVTPGDFDCVADGCGDLSMLSQVVASAHGLGITVGVGSLAPGAAAASVEMQVGGLTARVRFVSETPDRSPAGVPRYWTPGGHERRHVAIANGWLESYPAARSVVALLRYLFETARLNARRGGLSSLALLVMTVHCARRCESPENTETLLWCVLTRFAGQHSFATHAICGDSAEPVPRTDGTDADIVIVDPLRAQSDGGNLAAGCTQLRAITAQFEYVMRALMRWDSNASQAASRKGFRGRTPLSAIISHTPLWGRTKVHYEGAFQAMDDDPTAEVYRPWELADRRAERARGSVRPPAGLKHPVAACP